MWVCVEVRELQENSWESDAARGGRQWTYQTCTEFGWYQSTDLPADPWHHTVPVTFFEQAPTNKHHLPLLEFGHTCLQMHFTKK